MTSITEKSSQADVTLNLVDIVEDMFMVLTEKEKQVIVKRFSLDNKPRQTLERIGQAFSVTRERVRQIEKIALNKLRRTVATTKLAEVNRLTMEILGKSGGVLLEEKLVSELINVFGTKEDVDANILRLSLNINSEIVKYEKNNLCKPFWSEVGIKFEEVKKVIDLGIRYLNKAGDVVDKKEIVERVREELPGVVDERGSEFVTSAVEIDKRVKVVAEGVGLISWRHINPRSIRDKAYIVLKRAGKPLHFIDIANEIMSSGFDKKVVTTQAVHNELIRYDQFVLVGRGLYALKEWGFKKGTVADVIEGLLKKKAPLTKQEIIAGVLKQRKVKKGTISLNLQKNEQFVRVGRAVYDLIDNVKEGA